MSMFIAGCPGCGRFIGVPRPGSVMEAAGDGTELPIAEIRTECPFCRTVILSSDGREMSEPKEKVEEFDLLSVE